MHLLRLPIVAGIIAFALVSSGCSVRKFAVNRLGDALSGGGTAFSSDNDPELVKDAVPFSLKLTESLLGESPKHTGLLLAAAGGFTQYGYAFVQMEADEIEAKDLEAANAKRERARKLYIRAKDYALRGLEVSHPGFNAALQKDPTNAVAQLGKKDMDFIYWTAAAWGSIISLSKDSPETVGGIPQVQALVERAAALEPDYGNGSLESLLITFAMALPSSGDPIPKARQHFERAVQLSGGLQAGPYVALAENVSVKTQNAAEFEMLLNKALAVQVDQKPEWRLINLVMQRRAKWLLSRKDDLFLPPEPAQEPGQK